MSAPQCIGIILDGNRRWAKERGLPTLEGHRRGSEVFEESVRWIRDRGIPHYAAFVFSTENWKRAQEEVSYLMDLFREMVEKKFAELAKEGVRIRFIGRLDMLPTDLQESIRRIESASASNTKITVWVCMSYGSRAEIAAAAENISKSGASITEESLRSHFWSAEMPDPDIIIRPGGEKRLSNFLLWQAAYSELFFIDPYWPEFSEILLDDILTQYQERERRHGR
jgi:undecaprenyl diphosphate synthase